MRWAAPHSYMSPSILEQPCGDGRGILDAIEWLQYSALDWPSLNHRDEGYTLEMRKLHDVAEECLSCFEEFRTVFRSEPLAHLLLTETDTRWHDPHGRIPARIHEYVFSQSWRMRTTTLYDMTAPPSINALKRAGVFVSLPLRDYHLAAIAALACCVNCINDLSRILDFWRSWLRNRPHGSTPLHFDRPDRIGAWEDALLRLREYPENLLPETELRRNAFAWIERAEAWLAHGEQLETMREKVEDAAQRAATEAQQIEKKKRSAKAKPGSTAAAIKRTAAGEKTARKIQSLEAKFLAAGVPNRQINKKISRALGNISPTLQAIGAARKKKLPKKKRISPSVTFKTHN